MLEAVGVVVIFGLLVALAWSEFDVVSRGVEGSLFGGRSSKADASRSRDNAFTPQTWIPIAFLGYVICGLAVAAWFPHPHLTWQAAYIALPIVAAAWLLLVRRK